MAPIYRWTVDVDGGDWGGRSEGCAGIEKGLYKIIRDFKNAGIFGLFFISTELLKNYPRLIEDLRIQGQAVGSHGHFHERFETKARRQENKDLSETYFKYKVPFRAPKFSLETEDRYSQKKGHVSLLKHMWLKTKINEDTIIYLHPFDIVETKQPAPNLFCKLWYSRPRKAYDTFTNLLNRYPDSYVNEG